MKIKNKETITPTKVEMRMDKESIYVEFKADDKKGWFIYGLFGSNYDKGILESHYDGSDENDIYAAVHDWVENHIKGYTKIVYDNWVLE